MTHSEEALGLYDSITANTCYDVLQMDVNRPILVTVTNDPVPSKNGNYQFSKTNGLIKLSILDKAPKVEVVEEVIEEVIEAVEVIETPKKEVENPKVEKPKKAPVKVEDPAADQPEEKA